MLFQLTVLAPLFSTVPDLTSARAGGERPPLLRALTAPVRNPIALASGAGLLVSATGLRPPDAILAPVGLIGDLAVPAMLLAFGLSLRGAPRPGVGDSAPSLLTVLLLKNLVQPVVALSLGLLLGLAGHALLAVVVCAALPTAQNVFGYAVRFGQGVRLGRAAGLATTLLGVPEHQLRRSKPCAAAPGLRNSGPVDADTILMLHGTFPVGRAGAVWQEADR